MLIVNKAEKINCQNEASCKLPALNAMCLIISRNFECYQILEFSSCKELDINKLVWRRQILNEGFIY